MIKAAIFDMDGLLIDSEPLWHAASKQALKSVGIELMQDDFNKTLGRGITNAIDDWYHMKPWKGASQAEIKALIIDDFVELVKKQGKAKPGMYEVLELFKSKPLPMAIVSSTDYKIIDTVVDTLKIRAYFDVIYSAENETHGKPNPAIFISTSQRLGVKPRHCLVFEDAPSGVLAAKAATMKCIAVPEPQVRDHAFIQTADTIIDSLEDFDEAMLANLEK